MRQRGCSHRCHSRYLGGLRSPAASVVGMLEIELRVAPTSLPAPQQHPGGGLCLSVAPSATSGSRRASSYYSATVAPAGLFVLGHLSEAADNSASSGISKSSPSRRMWNPTSMATPALTCSRSTCPLPVRWC